MNESTFNIYKEIDDEILIYNTFSKAFVKIDKDLWERVLAEKDTLDHEHQLVKCGFFLENPKTQLDSYRLGYLQQCFSTKLLSMVIAPTMDCNLACSYCFEKGNKKPGIMAEEIEDKIIEFIKSQHPQSLWITWFGGEPLIGFPRMLSISKKLSEEGIQYQSSIISNGTLFNDYVTKNLKYLNLNRIQISMDGCKKDHDERRCFKNGKPTFDIVIDSIERILRDTNVFIDIQVTVDHNNENACEELAEYIYKRFATEHADRRIFVSKNFVKDRTEMGKDSGCFTNEDLIENDIRSLQAGKPESLSLPDTTPPCMHKSISNYAIDAEGYVYKCLEHLGVPEESVGSLKDGKLSVSKLAEKMLGNDFLSSDECLNCNILPICGGGCPVDRCKVAKGLKETSCSMYKSRFADLLPYYYNSKFRKS